MIKTINVKKCYPVADGEDFYALKGITIDVPASRLTILRGRSGSGKTTLLNIVSALDEPSEGEVFLDDERISGISEAKKETIRRQSMGYVFQSVALIPYMSAFQNVEYSLRLAGIKDGRRERVEECLELVGLAKRANHMPYELSGGEQQRIAIARAIAHRPKIIFADEPTAELDSNTGIHVIKIFKDLIEKERITVVMTTHDTEVMKYADLLLEIQDGEIING